MLYAAIHCWVTGINHSVIGWTDSDWLLLCRGLRQWDVALFSFKAGPRKLEIRKTTTCSLSQRFSLPIRETVCCCCTMVQNNQESRCKYWDTRLSVCSFARTAHSFAWSALLSSLTHSVALIRLLARSLTSSWESDWIMLGHQAILNHSVLKWNSKKHHSNRIPTQLTVLANLSVSQ